MNPDVQKRIIEAWINEPERYPPATEEQLREFEREHGPIPVEFRWFLSECGGGGVGSEHVDGIQQLQESHRKFKAEFGPPRGWTMSDVFVIGWDAFGNPFGIHSPTGRILVEDHNFGGIHEMAPSFDEFLIDGLLRYPMDVSPVQGERNLPDLKDCETVGKKHEWFNLDDASSGCYNCQVVRPGQFWRKRR